MKPEDQIKALAELDGYRQESGHMEYDGEQLPWKIFIDTSGEKFNSTDARFLYLHSYDAIIPLIQKQPWPTLCEVAIQSRIIDQKRFADAVPTMDNLEGWCALMFLAQPTQLCEALLRAVGKWKE